MNNQNKNKGAGIIETIVVFLFIGAGAVLLKVLRTGSNKTSVGEDTIYETSKNISKEMLNSLSYISQDTSLLQKFILIISLCSLIAFSFALISFIKRKRNLRITKLIRNLSYWLSVFTLLAALIFLIFHNKFFVSDDLRRLLENENTIPEVVAHGQSIEISIPNKTGIEAINRNYEVLDYKIIKSEAKLQNDSILSFQMSKVQPKGKWEEMKTNDIEAEIYPEFSMIIPSDSRLIGAVVNMEISLTAKIPYFPQGSTYYDLKEENITENVSFRIATPPEIAFYNDAGKFIGIIWYTMGGCLIFFILTMSFAGNSYYKPLKGDNNMDGHTSNLNQ